MNCLSKKDSLDKFKSGKKKIEEDVDEHELLEVASSARLSCQDLSEQGSKRGTKNRRTTRR